MGRMARQCGYTQSIRPPDPCRLAAQLNVASLGHVDVGGWCIIRTVNITATRSVSKTHTTLQRDYTRVMRSVWPGALIMRNMSRPAARKNCHARSAAKTRNATFSPRDVHWGQAGKAEQVPRRSARLSPWQHRRCPEGR
jgi:hypothetical protein